MNTADQLVTLALIRQVELQQVATWIVRDVVARLEELEEDVAAKIARANPTGATRPSSTNKRTRELLEEIRDLIREATAELAKRVSDDFEEVRAIQEDDQRKNWLLLFGAAAVLSEADKAPGVTGATVEDWFDRMADDLEFRISATVRGAVSDGARKGEIAGRVAGESDVARTSDVDSTKRAAETTVRTGIAEIPSEVETRLDVSPIGPHGWQHVSVLDNRTTPTCRGRAWRRWDAEFRPIGHSLPFAQPPLHPNCRSRIVMVMLDDEEPEHVGFKGFVNRLTPRQQDALFGKKRMESWRAGRLSDAELARQQGRALSVDGLRKRTEDKQGEFPFFQ